MQQEKKRPVLLHGVTGVIFGRYIGKIAGFVCFVYDDCPYVRTGSGKTEIYLQMIADVLEMGKQAVVLVAVPIRSSAPCSSASFSAASLASYLGVTSER